jgi:hypothetical protein
MEFGIQLPTWGVADFSGQECLILAAHAEDKSLGSVITYESHRSFASWEVRVNLRPLPCWGLEWQPHIECRVRRGKCGEYW